MSVENELLAAVDQIEQGILTIEGEVHALQQTIQPQVNALREQIGFEDLRREEAIAAVFAAATLEDLADPASALILYAYGWDNGRGHDGFNKFDQLMREDSYLRTADTWHESPLGGTHVAVLDVAFPVGEELDEDALKRTAEYIALLLPAQEELIPGTRVNIYGDDRSFGVAQAAATGEWCLYQQYSYTPYKTSSDLVEVLTTAYKHIALQRRIAIEEGSY